jgi:prepilin-type N-terminal cleavage/methylation domain-containing protein
MPISTRDSSERRPRSARGFTLIELALVLVIVAILLSFVTPRLMELGQARRESDAHRLAALLGYLHDEASLRGRTFRLRLDLDEARYEVAAAPPASASANPEQGDAEREEFVEEWAPLARSASLAAGVGLGSVETATTFASSGVVDLFFNPESDSPGARITLVDEHGHASRLVMDGVTGRVDVDDRAELDTPE